MRLSLTRSARKRVPSRLRSIAYDDWTDSVINVGVDLCHILGTVGVFILVFLDSGERFGFFLSDDWQGAPAHVAGVRARRSWRLRQDVGLCRPTFWADRRRPVQVV